MQMKVHNFWLSCAVDVRPHRQTVGENVARQKERTDSTYILFIGKKKPLADSIFMNLSVIHKRDPNNSYIDILNDISQRYH